MLSATETYLVEIWKKSKIDSTRNCNSNCEQDFRFAAKGLKEASILIDEVLPNLKFAVEMRKVGS